MVQTVIYIGICGFVDLIVFSGWCRAGRCFLKDDDVEWVGAFGCDLEWIRTRLVVFLH